jgi:drug/metabolite transporter (DMT)-like permease
MKRNRNALIWIGFAILVAGLFSYPFLFGVPALRDFPWVSVVALLVAVPFLWIGLARAWREPQRYRGRVAGTIVAVLAVGLVGFFVHATFVGARRVPASKGAPQVGSRAPDFTLPDQDGNPVTLSKVLLEAKPRAVVLVFYRGFW